ncbi:MAG TPA: TonB-dependent receptor plug domain-containing protein [Longimicrobium sp.]
MKRFLRPIALLRAAALAVAALGALSATPARAQDPRPTPRDTVPRPAPRPTPRDTVPRPAPRDTVRRDTIQVQVPPEALRPDTLPDRAPGDTTARDTAVADSLIPAPNFPEFPVAGAPGFGGAVWEFGREELNRFHGLNVLELLDRIPGILITRSGNFGRPAGVSFLGGGGGRFRVFLDGWELRPLNGSSFDLQRIPLTDIVAMRVERDLHEVRVDLSTFRLSDSRALAQVEGADGDYNTRILRGFFSRPLGSRFLVQVGLDVSESSGYRRQDPFAINSLLGRLSYQFRPDLGLQLDFRRSAIDTEQRSGSAALLTESLDRGELILRGRGRFLQRLWVDAAIGRSTESPAGSDIINDEVSSLQGYGRATMDIGIGNVSGALSVHRGEEGSYAPDASELSGRAVFSPVPWLSARGEVRLRTLGDDRGLETEAVARAGPFAGVTLFGQIGAGARAIPFLADTVVTLRTFGGLIGREPLTVTDTVSEVNTTSPTLAGLRAGAELSRGVYQAGAALVAHDAGTVAPYELPFDRGFGIREGGALTALEGYASFPVLSNNLRFDGWFVRRLSGDRLYLPGYFGRAALQFHRTYLTGNLEPTVRVEMLGRDRALVPAAALGTTVEARRFAVVNLFVQVRVVDVRVFYRLDNVFNQRGTEIPGTAIPGSRAMYGVRWFFRN